MRLSKYIFFITSWFVFSTTICFFLHSLCGFRDAITFKEIDDIHVSQIESYVQTELPDILETWKSCGIEFNAADFYGDVYVHSPKSFKFTIGDRLQIRRMVNYAKMKYDENGVEFSGAYHFDPHASKKMKLNYENARSFFGNKSRKGPAIEFKCTEKSENDDEKRKLIEKIAKIYVKSGVDSRIVGKLNAELVELQMDAVGKIRALFKCPLCDTSNKENLFVLHTKPKMSESSSTKIYWVLSNFFESCQYAPQKYQETLIES